MRTIVSGLLIATCLTFALFADEPAAVVNGEEIPRQQVQSEANLYQIVFGIYQQFPRFGEALLGTEEGSALLDRFERDVLNDIIDRMLMTQAALDMGLTADEDEVQELVDSTIARIMQQNQLASEAELEAALAQQGRTLENFREEIAVDAREHLVRQGLREEITGEATVSDEELRAYYDDNPDQFQDADGEMLPFEEIEEELRQELLQRKRSQTWEEWLSALREEADITINL